MVLADTLSRAHFKDADTRIYEEDLDSQVHMVYSRIGNDVGVSKIRNHTTEDEILSEIVQHIIHG